MRSGGGGRRRLLEAQGKGRKGKERIDHSFSLFPSVQAPDFSCKCGNLWHWDVWKFGFLTERDFCVLLSNSWQTATSSVVLWET